MRARNDGGKNDNSDRLSEAEGEKRSAIRCGRKTYQRASKCRQMKRKEKRVGEGCVYDRIFRFVDFSLCRRSHERGNHWKNKKPEYENKKFDH